MHFQLQNSLSLIRVAPLLLSKNILVIGVVLL